MGKGRTNKKLIKKYLWTLWRIIAKKFYSQRQHNAEQMWTDLEQEKLFSTLRAGRKL